MLVLDPTQTDRLLKDRLQQQRRARLKQVRSQEKLLAKQQTLQYQQSKQHLTSSLHQSLLHQLHSTQSSFTAQFVPLSHSLLGQAHTAAALFTENQKEQQQKQEEE